MLQDYPDMWCELAMLVILTHGQFHFYLVIKEIAWLSGLRQCSGFNYQFQVILRSCTLKGNNSPHCKTLVRQKVSDFVETGDKKGNKNWLKSALKPSPAWNPDQDSSKLTEMKIYGGLSCFFWECKYWGTWSFCRPHLVGITQLPNTKGHTSNPWEKWPRRKFTKTVWQIPTEICYHS